MDNASKALIMAGAILIAVALVGVGVYLYQSAVGTVDSANDMMNASEIMIQNEKFLIYMDKSISGREVKNFIDLILQYNANNTQQPIKLNAYSIVSGKAKFTHRLTESDIRTIRNSIQNNTYYTISVTACTSAETKGGYYKNGLLGCVSIKVTGNS